MAGAPIPTGDDSMQSMPSGMPGEDYDPSHSELKYNDHWVAAFVFVGLIPVAFVAIAVFSVIMDRRNRRRGASGHGKEGDIELGRIYSRMWFPWRGGQGGDDNNNNSNNNAAAGGSSGWTTQRVSGGYPGNMDMAHPQRLSRLGSVRSNSVRSSHVVVGGGGEGGSDHGRPVSPPTVATCPRCGGRESCRCPRDGGGGGVVGASASAQPAPRTSMERARDLRASRRPGEVDDRFVVGDESDDDDESDDGEDRRGDSEEADSLTALSPPPRPSRFERRRSSVDMFRRGGTGEMSDDEDERGRTGRRFESRRAVGEGKSP